MAQVLLGLALQRRHGTRISLQEVVVRFLGIDCLSIFQSHTAYLVGERVQQFFGQTFGNQLILCCRLQTREL